MRERASVERTVRELYRKLPKFRDGRINYSGSKIAPVVTAYIFNEGKLLLLKRSDKVMHYKSMWDKVSGYLDEIKDPVGKALEEVNEELCIRKYVVEKTSKGKEFSLVDKKEGVRWVIAPILVELSKNLK
jgi:isopentenyldiphosphate isomerase